MNKKALLILLLVVLILPFETNAQSATLNNIITSIRLALEAMGAIMAVVGFLIAGILWLTSGGSPEKTGLAKKALIAAIMGTIIVIIGTAADTFIKIIKEILKL